MSKNAGEKAAGSAEKTKREKPALTKEEAIAQGLELMDRLSFCLLGTNSEESYPNIKAMNNLKHEG